MDKKKGIILAVIIFLLIGLGTFVFANPSNESLNGNDNNSNNNDNTEDDNLDNENTNDGSGEEGEEEDTPNTDSDRGNSNGGSGSNNGDSSDELGQGGSNPGTGEKPSTPSENVPDKPEKIKVVITGIEDGKIYGSAVTPNISSDGIKNITLNNEAFTSGTKIADDGEYTLVVTDNNDEKTTVSFIIDTTAPKFNVSSGLHSDKAIPIEITDLTLDYVIIYNQDKDEETKVNKSEFILEEEATYKLTAVDKLGNETTVWVAIDKTKPDIKVSGTNAIENKFGGEVTLTVFDKFLTEVVVNNVVYTEEDFTSEGNNENRTLTLTYEYDSKNSGTYTVSAKDKFGHINTDEFTIDNDAPESKWVYILSADEDNRTIIGNNQKLIVEINVNEELAENPVITIGDWTGELTRRANDSRYIYSKTITIDAEEMKLVHDENIKFTIEVTDIFGNTTTLDNDNVTYHEENGYGQVKYDGEAPVYVSLGMQNNDHTSSHENGDITVANIGDHIRVLMRFDELLATTPKITIGDSEEFELKLHTDYENFGKYTYWADIELTEDMNLSDGALEYVIYGYADAVGNVGKTLSSSDEVNPINNPSLPGVTIDTKVESPAWIYTLNLSDSNNYKTIRDGQTLRVEANFTEELVTIPKLTIGDSQSVDFRKCGETSYGKYVCVADIKIDNSIANLKNNEVIPFKITNIVDKGGNTLELDNSYVTETSKYGKVIYDGEAPELINLGITGYTSEAEFDAHYVKNGKGIRILAYFNELLAVNPTITINGYEYTAFKATDDGKNSYSYFVDIPDISTLDLTDGIIKFTVSGYEDKVGNVGDTKTEEDITLSKYNKVIVDNTLPEFNFTNGDTFSKFTVKITEENIARLEVYSYGTGKTTTYEGEEALTWELTDGNCMYKLTAYDLAGNMDEIWIYHDRTAPSVTGTGKVASKDVEFIPGNKYQGVNLVVTDNDLKEVKIVNQLTNEEEVICKFNWDNTQDCAVTYDKEGKYQLVVTDRANNQSEYELIIDTTAPEFDLSQIPTEFEVGVDVYKYPQPGRVTDNMDGTLSFSNVNMNWYQKNADDTKGNSTKCFGYDNWNTSLKACPLGDYLVTYDIRDEAGNKAYVEKTITLKDTTPATLTFNREDGYVVDLGSDYQELGATISDNVDETKAIMPRVYVRFDLQMNNLYEYYDKIDTTKEGMYLAVFDYTDGAGNASSTLKRWVVVKDISAPVITGIEDNTTYFAGIGSHGYKVGGIRPKFSDNSGYMKIEIDGKETWTVDYNNSDSYNLFVKEGMPYHEILDGVDICAIDNTGNKECVENVTIIDFNSTDFADVLAQGGKIVLPPDVTINLNGNVNIPAGTTIIGDASTKLIGSLTLTGNDITLQNVNVENDSGASITINNDVQNIVIEGGSYTTTDASLQGQGTIRGMGNNTVSISNATLRGGIHLFNYAGSNDDLKDNNITLDYQGDTALSGVVITTNEEGKYSAQTIYTGNRFFIQNQPNSYYVLIQRPDWSTIDSVAINN